MQALQAGARSHQQKALGRASCSRSSVPVVARPQALRQTRSRASRATIMAAATKPQIMVNSVAGKMGTAVAEATLRAGLELVPYTLCATEVANANKGGFKVAGVNVMPLSPEERDARIADIRAQYPNLVMVDYTVPDVIHAQADFYNRHKTPFVMGTTGGDRARLLKETEDSKNFAVIAPNMGKQIVAFQAMFEYTAATFPGAFAGYKLRVVESHQSTKKDTSGTAKAVVASLQKLGLNFDVSQIELVRDPKEQVRRGLGLRVGWRWFWCRACVGRVRVGCT